MGERSPGAVIEHDRALARKGSHRRLYADDIKEFRLHGNKQRLVRSRAADLKGGKFGDLVAIALPGWYQVGRQSFIMPATRGMNPDEQ